jgi:hypothetical protein
VINTREGVLVIQQTLGIGKNLKRTIRSNKYLQNKILNITIDARDQQVGTKSGKELKLLSRCLGRK